MKNIALILTFFLIVSCGLYKPVDTRKTPVNVTERAQKNIREGRGFRLSNLGKNQSGGNFEFASSNEMWRATLEILDFLPLSDVDYGGGIIITEWYNSPETPNQSLKIMVQFLTNEIRADGIKVNVYEKKCSNQNNCSSSLIETEISSEIKLEILKKAALIKKLDLQKQ